MAKQQVRFKYVHIYNSRHGRPYAYYTPPRGKRIRLPLPISSPEFLAAYVAATQGQTVRRASSPQQGRKDDFDTLLRLYFGSSLFMRLSPSTRTNYRRVLEGFCKKHGDRPVSKFERKHAEAILGRMSHTPEAAKNLMKRLRMILNYAVDIRMIQQNPMRGMKGFISSGDGYHTWTDAEIAQFIERHPFGTKAYLALMLMLDTGQRRSDMVRMGWGDVADNCIAVRQQKTKTPLLIPISNYLEAALADLPKEGGTFLLTEQGRSFTAAGFGNWFRERCNEAGLPHCSAHGLRKACARRMAEAGCTPHEIKAITGHKTDGEVRRYTAKSDQMHLAKSALAKLQSNERNPKSANQITNVSKTME